MTISTGTPATPARPYARAPAAARPRRGARSPAASGRSGRTSTPPRRSRTSSTGWSASRLDPQLRPRRRGLAAGRAAAAASSPTPRSTRLLEAHGLGDRPRRRRRTSRPGSAPSSPGSPRRRSADGYLNTQFGRPGQRPRWSDLEWGHELYCFGHLFQAAVARARTRPGRRRRSARRGPPRRRPRVRRLRRRRHRVRLRPPRDRGRARRARPGDRRSPRYLEQAALFVERRGHGVLRDIEWGRAYYQDDVPVREATVLRGHAVRASYLAAGAVDVAVERGDDELLVRPCTAVGEHGRPAHVHHRRSGLAPPGRGVRRRLGAAAGPGVLRDLRGCRLGDVLLAAAAGPRGVAVRRPHRAHALQRRRDVAVARGRRLLLRQHAAPARARVGPARGRAVPAGVVVDAGAVVRGVLLPAERRPDARQPRRLRRDRRRRRHPAAPVRALAHSYCPPGRSRRSPGGVDRLSRRGRCAGACPRERRWRRDPEPAGPVVGRRRAASCSRRSTARPPHSPSRQARCP